MAFLCARGCYVNDKDASKHSCKDQAKSAASGAVEEEVQLDFWRAVVTWHSTAPTSFMAREGPQKDQKLRRVLVDMIVVGNR